MNKISGHVALQEEEGYL